MTQRLSAYAAETGVKYFMISYTNLFGRQRAKLVPVQAIGDIRKLGTTAGAYDDWHEGRDPAGITTQDPDLAKRLDPVAGGRPLANYLRVMTLEAQSVERACGKNHLHNLAREDLSAITLESAAMAQGPLAGTDWYPGKSPSDRMA